MAAQSSWKGLLHLLTRTRSLRRSRAGLVWTERPGTRGLCSAAGSQPFSPPLSPGLSGLSYPELHRLSLQDPERFWGSVARERLRWIEPFRRVRDCEMDRGEVRWFLGGRLNVSVNCLDVHVEKHPDRVALIWERDEAGTEVKVTYRELLETTCRLANTLKRYGVLKGDRVAIYMPVSPLAVAAMLACARIGAVHTVVFAGFSSEALAGRIQDAQCKVVLTCNQAVRGGRLFPLKATVDAAVRSCPSVQHVFTAQRTNAPTATGKLDVLLEEALSQESPECPPEPLDSEDLLFMLYTSGSTGKPKGIVHTQAGYLLYAALTHQGEGRQRTKIGSTHQSGSCLHGMRVFLLMRHDNSSGYTTLHPRIPWTITPVFLRRETVPQGPQTHPKLVFIPNNKPKHLFYPSSVHQTYVCTCACLD